MSDDATARESDGFGRGVFTVDDVVEVLRGLLVNAEDRVVPLLENCVKCYQLGLTDAIIKINERKSRG